MTGVEILDAQEVVASYEFSWVIYIGIIIVAASMSAATGYFAAEHLSIEDAIAGLIIGIMFGAIIGFMPASYTIPLEYETQYTVVVSDRVHMNEFLERYDIVSTDGHIYTVRERNG